MKRAIDVFLLGIAFTSGMLMMCLFLFFLYTIHPTIPIAVLLTSYISGCVIDKRVNRKE